MLVFIAVQGVSRQLSDGVTCNRKITDKGVIIKTGILYGTPLTSFDAHNIETGLDYKGAPQ